MNVLRRIHVPLRAWAMLAACAGAAALTPSAVLGQQRDDDGPSVIIDQEGRGTSIRRASGFRLFGFQDLAFAGMHGTGNLIGYTTNIGPCEAGFYAQRCLRLRAGSAPGTFHYFELSVVAGVPRGDWIKNRDRAPSLRNARGEGYSQMRNDGVFTGRMEIGPHDGTLGSLFSGATTTTDGTCLDNSTNTNGTLDPGLQLLASSNCPQTWPVGTWLGDRPVLADTWLQLFQSQGASFAFDFHRVPANLKASTRFLGSNFSTYGVMSDHHSGIRAAYGSVIPGGAGDPTIDGWPLGLVFEFQEYNFSLPTVAAVVYYQMLVINRSDEVYGVGLDYDSLYLGLSQGLGIDGQAPAEYFEVGRGGLLYNGNGSSANACNGSLAPNGVAPCRRPTAPTSFSNAGAGAVLFLKSPLGDLRNKLFSNPASPFYMPGHPLAGDTITYNHGHACGFSACSNNVPRFSDKRGFGLLSSTEENVLDGRTPGSLAPAEYWLSFRSRAFPTQDGLYNKWVPPGNWDYNHDGLLDTLSLESCGGGTGTPFVTMANGCIVTWSDTMPGKQNNRTGNIGGVIAAGPIRLAAGDTAAFMFAFVEEVDSIRTETAVNAAIDFYTTFFFGPEPPVFSRIVSSEVVAGGDQSTVTLFFTDDAERWRDPFLLDFANKLSLAPAGTELGRLVALDPNLIATVTAAAADNVQELHIYKSCDGGNSFTSDTDCDGDPAEDDAGNVVGTGWQAYQILRRSDFAGGDVPNVFTDNAVLGGHTYVYAVLSKTRGASFQVRDSLDTDGNGSFDAIGGRVFTVAPQLINTLSSSATEPNVAQVYVPFSNQAGSSAARMTLTGQTGGASIPFTVQFAGATVAGTYQAVFGNFISITEYQNATDNTVFDSTLVRIDDRVTALNPATGGGVQTAFDSVTGKSTAPRGVAFAGTPDSVVTAGGVTRRYFGPNVATAPYVPRFVVFRVTGSVPLFASTNVTGSAATPTGLFASPDYGGFVISVDNRNAGTFAAETTYENGAPIPAGNVTSFRVNWIQGSATRVGGQGVYTVQWTGDPFGVQRGFTLDFADPTRTEAALADSLAARTATPAPTDSGFASLLGVDPATLRPARLPFTITNSYTGRPVIVVAFTRLTNSTVLGFGEDTIRVAVPANEWVPGDAIALIDSVPEDSLSGTLVVLDAGGLPLQVTRRRVAFSQAVLGCDNPRISCNPTAPGTRGAGVAAGTGYLALTPSTRTTFHYYAGLNRGSGYTFDVTAPVTGSEITSVTRAQLDSIRVVPNPFVAFSTFQSSINESRVVFTHLPIRGTLRIYTVSGQFVQQITWTEADLNANGDLHYNLRTREGTDLATGMYIWVMHTDLGGRQTARGKFVVIRGRTF
jgi:hypothetical protein